MVTKKTSSKSKKSTKKTLLEVQNLSTHFSTRAGLIKAVNDVSFTLDRRSFGHSWRKWLWQKCFCIINNGSIPNPMKKL